MGEIRQMLKKRRFYLFSNAIFAVSKVRHLPHFPPLRYCHGFNHLVKWILVFDRPVPKIVRESTIRDSESCQRKM
jgi:hypothetical protein